MAGYQSVHGALEALEFYLKQTIPGELTGGTVAASVRLLGSADIQKPVTGNVLGIYAHRITIDDLGRNRHFANKGDEQGVPAGELPVNIHFLIIAFSSSATVEADLITWAMLQLANKTHLTISELASADPTWGENDYLSVLPESMSTEDMMRIWDHFDTDYFSTASYVAKTVRLRLGQTQTVNKNVKTRVFGMGEAEKL